MKYRKQVTWPGEWFTPIIQLLKRQRLEGLWFKDNPGKKIPTSCFNKQAGRGGLPLKFQLHKWHK
jgi:hypothetical protein